MIYMYVAAHLKY